jgi:uncharacterized membrane protein YeaQ/YmgE (transglycosylase-associated protein family)
MSNLVWMLLGLVLGLIVSEFVSNTGDGTIVDILFGVAGAVIGGWVFNLFVGTVTGVNIDGSDSVFAAVAGAIILLVLCHAVLRRRMR